MQFIALKSIDFLYFGVLKVDRAYTSQAVPSAALPLRSLARGFRRHVARQDPNKLTNKITHWPSRLTKRSLERPQKYELTIFLPKEETGGTGQIRVEKFEEDLCQVADQQGLKKKQP